MTAPCPKCRPILFKAEMVRTILAGTKTQTRRVMKPRPPEDSAPIIGPELYSPAVENKNGDMEPGPEVYGVYDADGQWGLKCPLGQPGDKLWCREALRAVSVSLGGCAFGEVGKYEADDAFVRGQCESLAPWTSCRKDPSRKTCPPMFMPRFASRITLEITNVSVERVQDISNLDILAEGISVPMPRTRQHPMEAFEDTHVKAWRDLWDSINAKRGFSWESNPWVWCYTFRRLPAEETK